jgi:hypothetical protein
MANIIVPLLVCLVGAVVHLVSSKGATLGGYAFLVGLFWCVYLSMTVHVRIG